MKNSSDGILKCYAKSGKQMDHGDDIMSPTWFILGGSSKLRMHRNCVQICDLLIGQIRIMTENIKNES